MLTPLFPNRQTPAAAAHQQIDTRRVIVLDNRLILVIEDDALVASWLCEVLQGLGFSIVGPASSGPEALSLAELHKPDIAIVDIQLSGDMDGIDVARAFEERFGIAVIFLSGLHDETLQMKAQTVHPVSFLRKPFRAGALLDAIETARDFLSSAGRAGSSAPAKPADRAGACAEPAVNFGRRRSDQVRKKRADAPFRHAE